MQVPYDEGVANRIGPESWVGARKNAGQALTGDMQAGISSREKTLIQGADAIKLVRKATRFVSLSRETARPCVV